MSEDKLREETKRLMEEKEMYQNSAKDTLKKIVDDKLEAVSKLKGVELSLTNLEAEYTSLRQLYDKSLDENKKLSEKLTTLSEDLSKKNKEELVSDMNTINEMKSELSDSIIKKADIYITADCESFRQGSHPSLANLLLLFSDVKMRYRANEIKTLLRIHTGRPTKKQQIKDPLG